MYEYEDINILKIYPVFSLKIDLQQDFEVQEPIISSLHIFMDEELQV